MTNTQLLAQLNQLLYDYTVDAHSRVVEKLILQIIAIVETQSLIDDQRDKLEQLQQLLKP
jgi:hypothetical protein